MTDFDNKLNEVKYLFDRYYRKLSKKLIISREDLFAEFQYVLFRCILSFDANKVNNKDHSFERYFNSAMKRKVCDFLRAQNRKNKTLDIDRVENLHMEKELVYDTADEFTLMNECIKHKNHRRLIGLKLMGYTKKESIKRLKITNHLYNKTFNNIRLVNRSLVKDLIG